jgi:hypothetical protein
VFNRVAGQRTLEAEQCRTQRAPERVQIASRVAPDPQLVSAPRHLLDHRARLNETRLRMAASVVEPHDTNRQLGQDALKSSRVQ